MLLQRECGGLQAKRAGVGISPWRDRLLCFERNDRSASEGRPKVRRGFAGCKAAVSQLLFVINLHDAYSGPIFAGQDRGVGAG